MKTFNEWLEGQHPEFILDEGLPKWIRNSLTGAAVASSSLFSGGDSSAKDINSNKSSITDVVPAHVWKGTGEDREKSGKDYLSTLTQQPKRFQQTGQFSSKSFTIDKKENSIIYNDGIILKRVANNSYNSQRNKYIRTETASLLLWQPEELNISNSDLDSRIKDKFALSGKGNLEWHKGSPINKDGRTYIPISVTIEHDKY
jgi:hypothetical protein